MLIKNKHIILRDMIASDIEDVIYWNTVATEWKNWDAPWLYENEEEYDWDAYRIRKMEEIKQDIGDGLRCRLELCVRDRKQTHIGAVSCYRIDDEYRISDEGKKIAIGMDICEEKHRGKGYGKAAYRLYIEYLKNFGFDEIYTQTWSGNLPLINMAKSVGFVECNRYQGIRNVKGKLYDGLTFVYR